MKATRDKKDPGGKRACAFFKTKEKYSSDQVWTLLKKYDRQKALMSASIGKSEFKKNAGPSGEQYLDREGLVAGHAYSVIQAVEVKEKLKSGLPKPGGQSFKLMQLRKLCTCRHQCP